MELFVCRGYSGEIFRVSADEHLPIHSLTPILAKAVGFFSSDSQNMGIYNLTKDFEYTDSDTLNSRGTSSGDLLIIAVANSQC